MSLKGAENLTFECDGKKYVVTEMYLNNVTNRAFEVYYTDDKTTAPVLIWKYTADYEPVPFDVNTCQLVVETNEAEQCFDIKVYKNYGTETQEDITKSLDYCSVYAYLVDDFFPANSIFGYYNNSKKGWIAVGVKIPSEEVPNVAHFYPLTLTNRALGKFELAVSYAFSKAGGQAAPATGSIVNQMNLPYSLTKDGDNTNIWFVIDAPYDMEIGTISFPDAYASSGIGRIFIYDQAGVFCYKAEFSGTPSVTSKTVSGETYNYVTLDLSTMSSIEGSAKLTHSKRYYIQALFTSNDSKKQGKWYYRNGGVNTNMGCAGYTTSLQENYYRTGAKDTSSMIDYGNAENDAEIFDKCHTLNARCETVSTGSYFNFMNSSCYYCTDDIDYGGSTSDVISMFATKDSSKVFIWNDGNSYNGVLKKFYFYQITTPVTISHRVDDTTGWPDVSELAVDQIIYMPYDGAGSVAYTHGASGPGTFYKVSSVTDTDFKVTNCNSEVKACFTDVTSTIKAKYEQLTKIDTSTIVVNTDRKYEILFTAKS